MESKNSKPVHIPAENGGRDTIRATYNALAGEYAKRLARQKKIKAQTTRVLLKHMRPIGPDDRVLDLGCGIGYDVKMLAREAKVIGIDISPEMVEKSRKTNRGNDRVTILEGDFLSMSFDGRQFKGLFANAFIHLFDEHEVVLAKMRSLLEPGGVAYISTTFSEVSRGGWETKEGYPGSGQRFRKHWTKEELEQALARAGFHIEKYFMIIDPYEKRFMNYIVRKPLPEKSSWASALVTDW